MKEERLARLYEELKDARGELVFTLIGLQGLLKQVVDEINRAEQTCKRLQVLEKELEKELRGYYAKKKQEELERELEKERKRREEWRKKYGDLSFADVMAGMSPESKCKKKVKLIPSDEWDLNTGEKVEPTPDEEEWDLEI